MASRFNEVKDELEEWPNHYSCTTSSEATHCNVLTSFDFFWSEWQDLNLRPPRPERGALPDCADSDKRRRLYDRPPGLQAPAVSHYLLFAGPLPRIGEHPGATIVLIEEFTPAAQSLRHENGRPVHWLK